MSSHFGRNFPNNIKEQHWLPKPRSSIAVHWNSKPNFVESWGGVRGVREITFAALDLTYNYGSCKAFNSIHSYGRRTCKSNTEVKLYYINCDDKRASFNKSHEGKLWTKLTLWRSLFHGVREPSTISFTDSLVPTSSPKIYRGRWFTQSLISWPATILVQLGSVAAI